MFKVDTYVIRISNLELGYIAFESLTLLINQVTPYWAYLAWYDLL